MNVTRLAHFSSLSKTAASVYIIQIRMSLFQLCPWWSTQCPDLASSYDAYSLHCCRLGLADNEKDYVVVGSHTGYLSVYYPTGRSVDEEASGDGVDHSFADDLSANGISRPNDLVLEMKLAQPIIGITSGLFFG